MDALFANPLADLSGPAFLLAYAIVTVAIVAVARFQIGAADSSGKEPAPAVAVDRDPYEIAFLRGGGNELLRFAVFDLVREGRLTIGDDPKGKLKTIVATTAPSTGVETSLQAAIVAFYATPRTTVDLFASKLPAQAAAYGAATFDAGLLRDRMISSAEMRGAATRIRTYGFLALLILAGYRFAEAFYRGHRNVIFLVLECALALFVLFAMTPSPRLSARGASYLRRLATAVRPTSVAPIAAGVGMLPILVAATGFGALAGTEYGSLGRIFPRSVAANSTPTNCSSGCGTSSSDSSSGSSSCGSGCGGGCGG